MKPIALACVFVAFLFTACSKGGDNGGEQPPPPPPPPPPGGAPTITSTFPEYVFWGKELTIDGSGFSTKASDNIVYLKGNKSCDTDTTWQKAEVLSATATRLKVKVPYIIRPNGVPCGNDYAYVRVTVNNKSVTSTKAVKQVGPLQIEICHPFGVGPDGYPKTLRPGDSSVVSAHLYTLYTRESGYYDKIKLAVNDLHVETVDRSFPGATCGGLTFMLSPAAYSSLGNCDKPFPEWTGDPARKLRITARIDGTDFTDTADGYVFNQPITSITNVEGNTIISKSAGGNPSLLVKGKYMHFNTVRWSTLNELPISVAVNVGVTETEFYISVPVGQMLAGKTYSGSGINSCGKSVPITAVKIVP